MATGRDVRWAARSAAVLALLVSTVLGPTGSAGAADEPPPPTPPGDSDERIAEPRIVGGTVAAPGAWPSQAAILVNDPSGTRFTCGGTVIDRSWVLTAAHCLSRPSSDPARSFVARPSQIDVLVGTQDLRAGGTRIHAVELRIHPGWDFTWLRNDVALIRLDRPVPGSVVPTALASANPAAGTDVVSVGWGDTYSGKDATTPVLRQVELDVVGDTACAITYGVTFQKSSMTCVNRDPGGTCQGDSGGPTFLRQDEAWVQIGITSWARGCGEGAPSVLARVAAFSTWIRWQIRYGPQPSAAAFVKRQHLDLFGRQPTGSELFDAVAALEDGRSTAGYAAELLDGATFRARSGGVIRLYRAIFLRPPDSGGLTFWMGEANRGVSLKRIADLMVRAPELVGEYGDLDDGDFVDLVYDNVLGRAPSPDEGAYWIDELASGRRTRGQVMVGFSESPEHRAATDPTTRVTAVYWALVRRVPTPTEITQWRTRTTGDTARFLLTSWTYANRF